MLQESRNQIYQERIWKNLHMQQALVKPKISIKKVFFVSTNTVHYLTCVIGYKIRITYNDKRFYRTIQNISMVL